MFQSMRMVCRRNYHLCCKELLARLIPYDGPGFDAADVRFRSGLELISMQERARAMDGSLGIRSTVGLGTLVVLKARFLTKQRHRVAKRDRSFPRQSP